MSNLKHLDMMSLDDIFEMNGGYVLNFSDRTIAIFFKEELGIDFDDPKFKAHGTSKGKRLRCLLQPVDASTAVRVLRTLWDYREAMRLRADREDKIHDAEGRLNTIVKRIEGIGGSQAAASPSPKPSSYVPRSWRKPDTATFHRLLDELSANWRKTSASVTTTGPSGSQIGHEFVEGRLERDASGLGQMQVDGRRSVSPSAPSTSSDMLAAAPLLGVAGSREVAVAWGAARIIETLG